MNPHTNYAVSFWSTHQLEEANNTSAATKEMNE
jgi:hypothetical protein